MYYALVSESLYITDKCFPIQASVVYQRLSEGRKAMVPLEKIDHLNSLDNLNVHLDKASDYPFSSYHKNMSNCQVYDPRRNPFIATLRLSLSLSQYLR